MPFIHLNREKGAAARRLYHKSTKIATYAEKYMPFIHLNRERGGAGSALISYFQLWN